MFAKTALVALVAAAAVSAQVPVGNYTSSLEMHIDPNSVSDQDRAQWCGAERTSCSQLCSNTDTTNDCSVDTLSYKCICGSNSSAPGLQYYSQTMPTFICQRLFEQCNQQNVGFARNQEACKTNIQQSCGTLDPSKADSSKSGGSSTSASSPQGTSSGAGSSPTSTADNKKNAAPTMGATQGVVAAAAAVGVFAYLL